MLRLPSRIRITVILAGQNLDLRFQNFRPATIIYPGQKERGCTFAHLYFAAYNWLFQTDLERVKQQYLHGGHGAQNGGGGVNFIKLEENLSK